jgi:hypothetical protein
MAIKVLYPKSLSFDKLVKAVETGMDAAAEGVRVDFYTTTRTWTTVKPKFNVTRQRFVRTVSTANNIYGYVSGGTKPYTIKPKGGRSLAFNSPFRAKTQRGFIGSGAGSKGSNTTFAKEVHHPGIKAREFAETIGKKWEKELAKTVQRAIDSAI